VGKGLIVGIVVAACLIGVVLFLGLTFLATNESKLTNKSVDYSQPENWLSLPSSPGKAVDVFYLYPTAWQKTNANDPNICDVDNPSMIKGSNAAFAEQATAFEPIANIYAPYYRQVYTASLLLPLQEQETLLKNATIPDVTAAFDYYINHYNNGRPFILAGHSQGSNALIYILSDYMKAHPDVYKRMVAAYVIGYSITPTYLANNPHLKFAEGPNDTGVIVSYNTEAPVLNGTDPVVLPGALVINPITWTRTEDLATANQSLGSYLPNQNGTDVLVKNYADAQINMTKGALICSTANPNTLAPGNVAVGKGIYHTFDYLFYYYNIRANVADRINHYFNQLSSTSPSYPIDSVVVTTVNRTLIPVPVPATSPKIKPYDIANFSKYGYGVWQYGPGLPYEKRLDIMSSTYNATDVTNVADLLNFFTMTDIHITDKESPAEAIFYGYAWNVISGYSPAMLHTTHTLDAAVQTINALNKQKQFDFGFSLGDDANSGQQNELKWFIDVLDGKKINPDSGIKDDPIPGPLNDYQDEYQAAGLNKSIPWYAVLGNHDHYWMGMYPPDDYVRNAFIGNTSLNMGNVLADPVVGINSRGYYMGVVNGSTPYGNIIAVGPVANFNTAPLIPAADPNRHFISRNEWIGQFLNSSSYPVGHGFNQTNAATGFACYTFEPKSNVPIKVIVLDDTQPDTDPSDETNGHGSLDAQRYNWLVNELDNGQAEGKLMVIAAHIPIGIDSPDNDLGSGAMAWSKYSYVNDTALLAKLHTYPNLILWVSGHRHLNAITAQKSPDPTRPELGFWEVETSSLREFPQQFRMFNIVRNSDNTISIFATDVDPAVKNGTLAATARSYAVAAKELFNATMPPEPTGAYNAQILKQLTPEMQNKIQNYGTPIDK
jgi:metallophosphoesterase (TIGR03768 family)